MVVSSYSYTIKEIEVGHNSQTLLEHLGEKLFELVKQGEERDYLIEIASVEFSVDSIPCLVNIIKKEQVDLIKNSGISTVEIEELTEDYNGNFIGRTKRNYQGTLKLPSGMIKFAGFILEEVYEVSSFGPYTCFWVF